MKQHLEYDMESNRRWLESKENTADLFEGFPYNNIALSEQSM